MRKQSESGDGGMRELREIFEVGEVGKHSKGKGCQFVLIKKKKNENEGLKEEEME